ncbi:MAG: hypothetical protein WBD40_26040, partial [Tepidisphaeraceae bacterium]
GSDDNAWARAEMCRNVPSAPIVQNEPISVATSAALDAAEGCDRPLNGHARRMTSLVIRPRSIFIPARDEAGEGTD